MERSAKRTPAGTSKPSKNPSHSSISPSIVQPRHNCAPKLR